MVLQKTVKMNILYRAFHNVLRDYKIYYKKTVGHVFTKPVHIEGTTQFFFPVSCVSSQFTFLPLGDAGMRSEKMAAPVKKSFSVLEYHTSKFVYCATCISCKVCKEPACRSDHSCVV